MQKKEKSRKNKGAKSADIEFLRSAIDALTNDMREVKEMLTSLQACAKQDRNADLKEAVAQCTEKIDALVMSIGSKSPDTPAKATKAAKAAKATKSAKATKPAKAANAATSRTGYMSTIKTFHKAKYNEDPGTFIPDLYTQEEVDGILEENEATLKEVKPENRRAEEQKIVYGMLSNSQKNKLRTILSDHKKAAARSSAAEETLVEEDPESAEE